MAKIPIIDIGNVETLDDADPAERGLKLWSMVLLLAIRDMATVIRFEPHRGKRSLIYRVNGLYQDLMSPPLEMADELIEQIEDLIKFGESKRRLARLMRWLFERDGTVSTMVPKALVELKIGDQSVDAIVTVPLTKYGKSVIIYVVDSTENVKAHSAASRTATEFFKRMFGSKGQNRATEPEVG